MATREHSGKQQQQQPAGKKPLSRDAESLGWLAQSSVQPKKRRDIEGVGASSILDLKAQLYRTQEEARLRADGVLGPGDSTTRRKVGLDITRFNRKNAGVDDRNSRDEEAVQRARDRVGECYAALERKAKLYEQLVRGEVPDQEDTYNVDFLSKHTMEDEADLLNGGPSTAPQPFLGDLRDIANSSGRQDDAADVAQTTIGGGQGAGILGQGDEAPYISQERQERIQVVHELARETESGRSKAEQLKQRRQQQQAQKRERLKQEFLKKQVAKIRAAKAADAASAGKQG